MKKLKSDDDRLSRLQDSVIFLIFSFMDMRDVVKTTLLSKRWKDLWMITPYLNFDEKAVENKYPRNPVDSRNFINRALLLWDGAEILKFKVSWSSTQYMQLSRDLDVWLCFATAKNVRELELNIHPCPVPGGIPIQSLQFCTSLQKLSSNCDLVLRGAVHWRRLRCLTLSTVSSVSQDLIDRVFSGSPQLENFDLQVKGDHGELSIQSSSLKRLSLRSSRASTSAGLQICAPKLEALVIQGAPHTRCLLTNVPSLSRVNLDFKLSPDGFKMMVGDGMTSLNAKELRVRAAPCQLILDLMQIFPKLEMLAIDLKQFEADDIIFESMPLFMQLTAVEITWYKYGGSSMSRVIECLLKHAPILAKMVIKNGMVVRAEDASLVAQKLLSLQRSFQAVSFNILHQNFTKI